MAKKSSSHEIATPDGIVVHCKHDAIVSAAELKFYPGNFNKHPKRQLEVMHRIISGNGWRRPVVVSKLSGFITRGNGTVEMAKARDMHVPVEYQDYKSRREEIRDLIADKKAGELAEDDEDALRKLLSELDKEEIEFTGVLPGELEALIRDAEIPEGEFPITAKLHESYDYVLVFTDNESDFVFLQTLCGVETERSYKKTGVGLGRALPFKRFLESIRENHHSIHVQGGDHDHASARPRSPRVRAKKSAS